MPIARRVDPAVWGFLAVTVVGLVQVIALDRPGRTAAATVPFLLATMVLVVVSRWGRDDAHAWRVVRAVAVAGVLLSAVTVGAFLAALPAGIGEPSGFYRVKVLVTTPVGDHNTVGGLLLAAVVASVLLAVEDRRWWSAVVVTTLGTVATLSRGAALVLLAVGFGSLLVRTRRRVTVAVLVAGAVATAGVTLAATLLDAAPPPGAEVPDGPIGTSVVGRVDLAVRGAEVLAAEPLLGTGLGGFGDAADDLPVPSHHAHNAVTHLGAEAGVVGVVVAVGLPVLLAWRGLRLPRGWRRELVLLGGAGLVVHAQVDILAGLPAYEVLLAVLLALAVPSVGRTGAPPAGRAEGGG